MVRELLNVSLPGGSSRRSRKSHAFFLCTLLAYSLIFVFYCDFNNSSMAMAAALPVMTAAWLYGAWAGCLVGLLSLPLNFLLSSMIGFDWYDKVMRGGGIPGTFFLMLIGTVLGRVSDLTGRLRRELAARQRAEQELQHSRRSLEQLVADRTAELTAANQQLLAANQELVVRQGTLAANQERLRAVVDTALDAIVMADSAGVIIDWNKAAERMYGYSAAEVIGRPLTVLMPERFRDRDRQNMRAAMGQGTDMVFYNRIQGTGRRRDGTEFPTEISQSVWKSGDAVFATGFIRDITDRQRAQEALRESEERLRAIVETALDGIVTTDRQGVIVSWNRAAEKIFGYREPEALGRLARMLVPERSRRELDARREAFWRQGLQTSSETTGMRKDGTEFPIEVTRALWSSGAGQFATAIVRDITQRKNAEHDSMLLRTVIEQADENVTIMDARGTVVYANPALVRFMAQPVSVLLGKNVFQPCDSLYDQRFWDALYAQLHDGKAWKGTLKLKLPGGRSAFVEQTLSPVFDGGGTLINILGMSRDITREHSLEEQLRQSQKMEAIGTLAGGIAHDFNNILAAIMGYAELAAMEIPAGSVAAERLRRVLASCDRARALVRQILTFSRKSPQEPVPVKVGKSVEEALRLLRASLPSTIDIRTDLREPGAVVLADPTRLHQLLLNLCTNAAQAMEETGGILSVSLDRYAAGGDDLQSAGDVGPGVYARLIVRDTGVGIPPEVKERIFEPFFTTKAVGKGTGMGLAVAHGIVRSCGGCLYADSEPGRGSAFHVLLPLMEAAPAEAGAERRLPLPRGGETVLLVDDEEPVVQTCRDMLVSLGYSVVATGSSAEALELFSARPGRFDCVITDMTMPCMRGDVLAQRLLELRPGLPVVLCTGYSEKISEQQARDLGIRAFLLKPHTMRELAAAVRGAIDAPAAADTESTQERRGI